MISVTQLKDALAVTGAVTVVAFLAFVGGTYVGRRGLERQLAASDSTQLARARADSMASAGVRAQLDSALAGWAAARGRVDTVRERLPARHDAVLATAAPRPPADTAPAMPPIRIDSVVAAGDALARACTALAHDCAEVRAARDSLAVALARTRTALTARPSFWQRWHLGTGPGCAVSLKGDAACGATLSFSYTIW